MFLALVMMVATDLYGKVEDYDGKGCMVDGYPVSFTPSHFNLIPTGDKMIATVRGEWRDGRLWDAKVVYAQATTSKPVVRSTYHPKPVHLAPKIAPEAPAYLIPHIRRGGR